jgi:hypothetical protein
MCHVNPSPTSHWPSLAHKCATVHMHHQLLPSKHAHTMQSSGSVNTTNCYPPSTHQSSGSEWISGWVVGKKSIDDGAQMLQGC